MTLTHMKISTRLSLGFGLILSMMTIMVFINFFRLQSIEEINEKIIDKDIVKLEAANAVNLGTRANARRTLELLVTSDLTRRKIIQERIEFNKKTIADAMEILDTLVYLPEGKALVAKIKETRANYVASFSVVKKLVDEGKNDEAISKMTSETLPLLDALQEPINMLEALQKKSIANSSAEAKQNIASARTITITLGLLALILGFAAGGLITRGLIRQLGGEPDEVKKIANAIAAGDLTQQIDINSRDQSSVLFCMREMSNSLASIVTEVRGGTDTIATASRQIAAGNLDLSSRTENQASSLEETASSMEELTSTVKQNADNARQANQLANSASGVAIKGGKVVAQVVETMGSINASAKKIVDIISVIEGIAFQTNILALNAAVEAARAGEQGRGFAVVASEVRSLAQRSASAAKEIKTLIDDSVEQVDIGAKLVDQAGLTMKEIVESVQRVNDIMSEITTASNEQTAGIDQINIAISEMDNVTQQNAALVEEAAAAASQLEDQASDLSQVVSVFRLHGEQTSRVHPARQMQSGNRQLTQLLR